VGIFHLYFLLRLTKYLGFYPDTSNFSAEYFDLMEGCFTNILPHHPLILRSKETSLWAQLLKSSFDTLSFIVIKASEKRVILTAILEYYKIHIEGLIEVKSHQILEEVLN
jgi:DNA repair protein RecO (recombination protein O)